MQLTSGYIILLMGLFLVVTVKANDESDCRELCPLIYQPVCGTIKNSEGENVKCTFANECFLKIFTCRTKQELEQKPGSCADKNPQCIGAAGSIVRHPLV
ncbi:hypothetical protein FF38_02053 [Lucilia cuprina]|uniref:Kazal-like domain-containing protein n=1 Tax=Lucilia cuprina TaxID=7375 RepID=A0A0L0BW68_LUCCU|nr:hypothetical protein FF38_02053 [Lucilia cuprina]